MQETLVQVLGQEDPLEKGQTPTPIFLDFPGGSAGKQSACNVGDLGLIPGEVNSYPFQFSGLENSMDYKDSDTTKYLTFTFNQH